MIDKTASRLIRSQIRKVLLHVWDPIGIQSEPNAQAAQHRKNTWPGIVGRTFGNSPLLLQMVRGIMH
jgi:hypothetical protein